MFISVKIITPSCVAFESDSVFVSMPGQKGVFAVLPGHALFVIELVSGIVHIEKDQKVTKCFISDGIVQVTNESVNIITDFSYNLDLVDRSDILDKIKVYSSYIDNTSNLFQVSILKQIINQYQTLLYYL